MAIKTQEKRQPKIREDRVKVLNSNGCGKEMLKEIQSITLTSWINSVARSSQGVITLCRRQVWSSMEELMEVYKMNGAK